MKHVQACIVKPVPASTVKQMQARAMRQVQARTMKQVAYFIRCIQHTHAQRLHTCYISALGFEPHCSHMAGAVGSLPKGPKAIMAMQLWGMQDHSISVHIHQSNIIHKQNARDRTSCKYIQTICTYTIQTACTNSIQGIMHHTTECWQENKYTSNYRFAGI